MDIQRSDLKLKKRRKQYLYGGVGAALVMSVSAFYVLKGRHLDLAKRGLTLGIWVFGVLAALQAVVFGANMAISVTNNQPVKLAAMEGVWESQSCAPMFLVGWVDEAAQTTTGISIPCLLSFLSYGDIHATVTGLESFSETCPPPRNSEWDQCGYPPVNLAFQAYHVMINLAMFFALMAVVGSGLYLWKRKLFEWRWVLWVFVVQVALVEAAPEGYRARGKFSLPGQPDRGRSKAWAYPVVANGKLYFRDLNVLWCYDIRGAGPQ